MSKVPEVKEDSVCAAMISLQPLSNLKFLGILNWRNFKFALFAD